jgi:hypothetical protein
MAQHVKHERVAQSNGTVPIQVLPYRSGLVRVKRNIDGEYEVPTSFNESLYTWESIYYTDDREDAIATALLVWGSSQVYLGVGAGTYDDTGE